VTISGLIIDRQIDTRAIGRKPMVEIGGYKAKNPK
jgi:hypothetical protein